jgi:hypothetical protein
MEERKYCKDGDGKHVTETETLDPSVPNRARTEMKTTKEGVEKTVRKDYEPIVPTIEG